MKKHWTRAKEICKSLKYEKKTGNVIRDHVSNENITQKCQLIGKRPIPQFNGLKTLKNMIFTSMK